MHTSTVYLMLIWAILGLLVGVLACAAHLQPTAWSRHRWLWLAALGLGAALLGGLLGFWLFGRIFASASALWIAVLATCAPGLYSALRTRLGQRGSNQE
jgi:uncharacterized membrane protein